MFNYPDSVRFVLGDTIEYFEEKSQRDFESIKPWIPNELTSILDIGAGLGAINILIRREKESVRNISIIDGDGTADHGTGFREETIAWGDRNLGKEFIEANVPWDCKVNAHIPDPNIVILSDLIISLKSWGHHYPVGVYINLAKRSLKPNGRVILDIRRMGRKNQINGREIMEDHGFKCIAKAVYESPKCERMIFER